MSKANIGKKITRIEQIKDAALCRLAIICPNDYCFHKHIPAAFIINLHGRILCRLIESGMYLYKPIKKRAKNKEAK